MTNGVDVHVNLLHEPDDPSWQRWGPYMSNREWGTIRQTDGPEGCNWEKLPYRRAGQTAYTYSEDGIFGVCDLECRICHAYAFWNYKDDQLKERFFGVANGEGAHGEDVKEMYYYRAADPQYRYICSKYLYPQIEFPYRHLVSMESQLRRNSAGSAASGSVALPDMNGWFQDQRYFEIEFEMCKLAPDQLYFQLTVTNCGAKPARLIAMPMLFLRNTWSLNGISGEDPRVAKVIRIGDNELIVCIKDGNCEHNPDIQYRYFYDTEAGQPEVLLTENHTRPCTPTQTQHRHYKDSFNRYLVCGDGSELIPNLSGDSAASKAGICYRLNLQPRQQKRLRGFLVPRRAGENPSLQFNWNTLVRNVKLARLDNLMDTYQSLPTSLLPAEQDILHAAFTTLLWNRQYYPLDRMPHLWHLPGELPTRLVTVPDKWEQPYLATWDTALHCLCLNCFDRQQALRELMLLLALIRPDGSMYCDEYRPDGVTPPLVVLAAIDVYGKFSPDEKLALGPKIYRCLKSHLLWWLHRKDVRGVALIDGGICGVDYVSLFPRELVEIGEGLVWALFFTMRFLELALAIYQTPCSPVAPAIEQDLPGLIGSLGRLCGAFVRDMPQESGLFHPSWLDVADIIGTAGDTAGTKKDRRDSHQQQRCNWLHAYCYLPMICCSSLPNLTLSNGVDLQELFAAVFKEPTEWESRAPNIYLDTERKRMFITVLSSLQLAELLEQVLSEIQFLSPYGIRTMSLMHTCDDATVSVTPFDPASSAHKLQPNGKLLLRQMFCSGTSVSKSYGGNTNWYGSVNLPYNYLVLEAMHKWSTVLNGKFDLVEYPFYTGRYRRLKDIVQDLAARNVALFMPNANGIIPSTGDDGKRGMLLCETFDGDTGRGHGAAHKGGWSAIIAKILFLMHGID